MAGIDTWPITATAPDWDARNPSLIFSAVPLGADPAVVEPAAVVLAPAAVVLAAPPPVVPAPPAVVLAAAVVALAAAVVVAAAVVELDLLLDPQDAASKPPTTRHAVRNPVRFIGVLPLESMPLDSPATARATAFYAH
jgi:hypothetical protein